MKTAPGLGKAGKGAASGATALAPLLFWLAVVCGLAGNTMLRIDRLDVVAPMWFGALVGIAIGQTLAILRLRIWVILAVGTWLSFGALGALVMIPFGWNNETMLLALLPACVCGYASMTERGGLLAFWFPAMLWMLVILEGSNANLASSVGLVTGLVVLFIAFLRARETRRVALWRSHASTTLARSVSRSVLRASPLRRVSETAWAAFVGGVALLLAVLVAPELWLRERELHRSTLVASAASALDDTSGKPCCHPPVREDERIREYLPLTHGHAVEAYTSVSCVSCDDVASEPSAPDWTYRGTSGAGMFTSVGRDDEGAPFRWSDQDPPTYNGSYYDPAAPPMVPMQPTPPTTHGAGEALSAPVAKPVVVQVHAVPAAPVAPPAPAPVTAEAAPAAPAVHPIPVMTTAPLEGAPWGWFVGLVVAAGLLPLGARALRRSLTLRHFVRPFWNESIDQKVSNQWQRMLIGLRDAGIERKANEQPQAFARRIGIEGMAVCATTLERVRHGVRIDEADLTSMEAAAGTVYRRSRERAGAAARLVGAFRWPLV